MAKELYFGNSQVANQYYTVNFGKKNIGDIGWLIVSTPTPLVIGDRLIGLGYSGIPTLEVIEILEESQHTARETKDCVKQKVRCVILDNMITT